MTRAFLFAFLGWLGLAALVRAYPDAAFWFLIAAGLLSLGIGVLVWIEGEEK